MQIYMVKTPTVCFITDCLKMSGYEYEYHRTQIATLYFDGTQPTPTFAKNWLKISNYPATIQKLVSGAAINKRYEIKDAALCSEKLPAIIDYDAVSEYDESVIDALYR